MKFATLKSGARDGTLVLVSRDLSRGVSLAQIAPTLQHLLDNWEELATLAEEIYAQLNLGKIDATFPLVPSDLAAPLPRAYQWADSSAYVNHIELVRKSRGAEMPPSFWKEPIVYQGGSDTLLGPCDNIFCGSDAWGCDFEAEVAVITGDVPMACSREDAMSAIRLVTLVNDVSLRGLIPTDLARGFGFFHGKPSSAFSPVAVTPDEFRNCWDGSKVSRPLVVHLNDEWFGSPNAGVDMTFDFPFLITWLTKTRRLSAGTIVGAGTVSNVDPSSGSCCIAEKRTRETLTSGAPSTPYLKPGDRVRIEMFNVDGQSIFGAIDQIVTGAI